MRYDSENNLIHVSVREAVSIARRGVSSYQQYDEDHAPLDSGTAEGEELSLKRSVGGIDFLIFGKLRSEDGMPTVSAKSYARGAYQRAALLSLLKGEAYVLAYMMINSTDAVEASFKTRLILESGEIKEEIHTVKRDKLEAFFNKCIGALTLSGRIEIERVTERLPSMKAAKFPYGTPREGQSEFIHEAYRAIARGGRLYASAPTGTGKTVSAIFPAIRAIGAGKCDKAFYLTPKATTTVAAKECIELFAKSGVFVRSVIIIAKDKICIHNRVCKDFKEACSTYKENNLPSATLALADKKIPTVTPDDVKNVASEYGVCPYELSLCYAELCDVIICDFNYLFDPDVYFRRFFSQRGNFAFLVDEAHNLAERAREMYSAKISLLELLPPPSLFEKSPLSLASAEAIRKLRELFGPILRDEIRKDKDGTDHAAYHTKNPPNELYGIISNLHEAAEDELVSSFRAKDDGALRRTKELREYAYRLGKLNRALSCFDSSYELFVFLEGGELSFEVFCLDTGAVVDSRLSLGSSAVVFSGTLSPIDYYRSVLGADRTATVLEVDSPFDRGQLSVNVMNTVTTRISEREKSLSTIISVIAATLSAKRGHYMVFSPSFAYTEALYEAFVKKYPKIKAALHKPTMTQAEKNAFLASFSEDKDKYLVAFSVLGGIFSEGIDLVGDKLIGAVVVGIGMPQLSFEREAIAEYYTEKMDSGIEYAYLYPGMNRVLQAAGRVIRTETDKGVIVLIDDRFNDPLYRKSAPKLWGKMKFLPNAKILKEVLDKFWA